MTVWNRLPRRRVGAPVAALFVYLMSVYFEHGRSTYVKSYVKSYVYLANGLLHRELWMVPWWNQTINAAIWKGHPVPVDGLAPVVFFLPLVAFYGVDAVNQTLVATALGALAVYFAWQFCERSGVRPLLLVAFLFMGTDVVYCMWYGDQWLIASVAEVCATMGGLAEIVRPKPRWWFVLALAVFAAQSRGALVLAFPLYAYALKGTARKRFIVGLGSCCAIFSAYCFWFWGVPYDPGHTLFFHQDEWGMPTGSPFGLRYLPYGIQTFLFQSPDIVKGDRGAYAWPYFAPDFYGCALTFTSPALVLALLARTPRPFVTALWLTALAVAVPSFTFYANGAMQFGTRHSLDFIPFLFALMVIGVRDHRAMPRWGYALCWWSIAFGIWGEWYWEAFKRTGNS